MENFEDMVKRLLDGQTIKRVVSAGVTRIVLELESGLTVDFTSCCDGIDVDVVEDASGA